MKNQVSINYVEFPATNLKETKQFFTKVFGWTFEDFGEQYTAFSDVTIEGGFYQSDMVSDSCKGAALIVFLSNDLDKTQKDIVDNGGQIKTPIFDFPGGKRFHFTEPSGNEFAVWTKL